MNLLKQILKKFLISFGVLLFTQIAFSQTFIEGEAQTEFHKSAYIGERVVLSGKDSFISGQDSIFFMWSFVSKPEDSKAKLLLADTDSPYFYPDKEGFYTARLYVYYDLFISEQKDIVIYAKPSSRPVAVAGGDEAVQSGTLVDLDGSLSFYFGPKDQLSYEWVLESAPRNSSAYIYFPNRSQSSFYADIAGVYLVRLTVKADQSQVSLPDYKVVRVGTGTASSPVASTGEDQVVITGENLNLTGTVSYSGSESLSYEWKIEKAPENSSPNLSNTNSLTPTFTTDLDGEYLLSFQATAGNLKGALAFITILSVQKPKALILDSNIIAFTNSNIELNGNPSFDPLGQNLSYEWTVLDSPQGSSTNFSNNRSPKTSFSADIAGDYTLQLIVQNSHFPSDPVQARISLISESSIQSNAGLDRTIIAGSRLNLSASSSTGENIKYFWTLREKPDFSLAEVLENHIENPNVFIDKAGSYIFRLQVEREGRLFPPDYVTFNAVLPQGTEIFSESFNPSTQSLLLPISQCEEVNRTFAVQNPANKEIFVFLNNQGVEESFISLNGQALTGLLEYENSSSSFVYPVVLTEDNRLSLRLRGLSSRSLNLKIIEKSSSQSLPSFPILTAQDISVSLGGTASSSISPSSGLTYSLLEDPLYGSASVNSQAVVRYTSNGDVLSDDYIVVKAVNLEGLVNVIVITVRVR